MGHPEEHTQDRASWLRAAVLGANDGIVSTASLVLGVAAADANPNSTWVAGLAGLIGGALSMAAGEYVSVSSQRDVEEADLATERRELREEPERELEELCGLVQEQGLPPELARQVAVALTEHDALKAHARLELGINVQELARPVQAAIVSAISFSTGAAVPLAVILLAPAAIKMHATLLAATLLLGLLGAWSAHLGGAPVGRATARVVVWGLAAMGLTAAMGHLFGAAMG
ncbi:MAG: VIT family protein [Myxococcota bacterium]|nr:VIT family protein [Myxococcota bacterium]